MTDGYLEIGKKRIVACALDWPGWARSARTEELALAALMDLKGLITALWR